MTTTVEYIRYRIAPDDQQEFEAAYGRAAESLAASPECIDYELAHSEEEAERYILRIRWTSVADHLEGFRKGEQFPAFFSAIRPYVSNIEEMKHYRVTDVVGPGKAASRS
ncbi:antibiotic biosynthesis monooxygenase family protein [Streptomyces sp. NPDC059999]|uniref:putative quinol monooxygenase n=1 Tax=unclassified Streptomyces TaxID=2593676 RepID=UPI002E3330BE|nr:antibiotic biosynthesis monooxygenase family protein [Streptomyces sp. NBC_01426]